MVEVGFGVEIPSAFNWHESLRIGKPTPKPPPINNTITWARQLRDSCVNCGLRSGRSWVLMRTTFDIRFKNAECNKYLWEGLGLALNFSCGCLPNALLREICFEIADKVIYSISLESSSIRKIPSWRWTTLSFMGPNLNADLSRFEILKIDQFSRTLHRLGNLMDVGQFPEWLVHWWVLKLDRTIRKPISRVSGGSYLKNLQRLSELRKDVQLSN